jgi:hypothetical protein
VAAFQNNASIEEDIPQGLKPVDFIGVSGTTEVVPCYKTDWSKQDRFHDCMNWFLAMDERGRGRPRYSRPGGRRYIF